MRPSSTTTIVAAFVCIVALVVGIVILSETIDDHCRTDGGVGGDFGLVKPTKSKETTVTQPFGRNGDHFHYGVDFAGDLGTPLYAFAKGTVLAAQDQGVSGFGGWIVLGHQIDGKPYTTIYGHEDPGGILVRVGQEVKAGDKIGYIGNAGQSTGPHLHFEVVKGNRLNGGTPVDPEPWLKKAVEPESPASQSRRSTGHVDATEVQRERARQIIRTGHSLNVPEKGIALAVAVAQVESGIQNLASNAVPESLNYPHDDVAKGDADSVGVFQQRPSKGWGTVGQLMDPTYAASKFYQALMRVDGWQTMTFTQAGYAVQRCREDLAGKYGEAQDFAEKFVAELDDRSQLSVEEKEYLDAVDAGTSTAGDPCLRPGTSSNSSGSLNERIIAYAREQEGLPYIWAGGNYHGSTNGGFDCSGLVLYAIYQATDGKARLEHQTNVQIRDSVFEHIDWDNRQPGDILYFGSPADWHHTSIYTGIKDGKDMQFEAQQSGVALGEYPVRFGEQIQVRRVKDIS